MNRNLFLVRHGEVNNPNHVVYGDLPGFHLSPSGVQQVHRTGRHLAEINLDLVVTSPLIRAIETAVAIARQHGIDPITDPRLTESGQFPHWTGNRWESIPALFPGEFERYLDDALAAGGNEPISDVAHRYVSVVDEALADGHRNVIVVGHQDPIQATRLSLMNRGLGELRNCPPRHGEVITLTPMTDGQWTEESRWDPERPTI